MCSDHGTVCAGGVSACKAFQAGGALEHDCHTLVPCVGRTGGPRGPARGRVLMLTLAQSNRTGNVMPEDLTMVHQLHSCARSYACRQKQHPYWACKLLTVHGGVDIHVHSLCRSNSLGVRIASAVFVRRGSACMRRVAVAELKLPPPPRRAQHTFYLSWRAQSVHSTPTCGSAVVTSVKLQPGMTLSRLT